MKNNCIINFSNAGHYKDNKWLAMEKKAEECKGKVKKWKSAQGGKFREIKRGFLVEGNDKFVVNDKYGGCDYETIDKKGRKTGCITSTVMFAMRENFGKFKLIKQSSGKSTTKLLR